MDTILPISLADREDSVYGLIAGANNLVLPIHRKSSGFNEHPIPHAHPSSNDARKLAKVISIVNISGRENTRGLNVYQDFQGNTYSAHDLATAGFFEPDWTPGMNCLHFILFDYLCLDKNEDLVMALAGKGTKEVFSWAKIGPRLLSPPGNTIVNAPHYRIFIEEQSSKPLSDFVINLELCKDLIYFENPDQIYLQESRVSQFSPEQENFVTLVKAFLRDKDLPIKPLAKAQLKSIPELGHNGRAE